jgi:hypothetical protein
VPPGTIRCEEGVLLKQIVTILPAEDMDRARKFYEETLGEGA